MPHPLVDQLRFTRSELRRALDGISDADARRRLKPMNCISWMIGHLAWQEHKYWLEAAQGKVIAPQLDDLTASGRPASTLPLDDAWSVWQEVTTAADPYLDTLTPEGLQTHYTWRGQPAPESVGTMLLRVIYHYWFHIGEALAVRQMLGHSDLPEFVGGLGQRAPYRQEQ